MKNFKKLIREAHLGNPLNEEFSSTEQKMINQIKSYKKRGSAMVTLPSKVRDFYFKNKEKIDALNENMGEWPKELTSRYSDEYRFELEKVMSDRAKYRVIDIESGELKGTPVFGKPESLMAYADNLIKPQGGTQSSHFGTNEGTCGYGEDGKVDPENTDKLKPAGPINEIESGDVVTYKGKDHTVQRIEDDDLGVRVYIRPNEEAAFGGKKDTFWVKPEDLKEDLQLDVDLYSKENPGIFTKADERVQVTIPGKFGDNEGDTALEKALTKLGKKYASYKVKDVKELNEDDELNVNVDNANDNYAKAMDAESRSGAYESLQETLRKKLQDRLK